MSKIQEAIRLLQVRSSKAGAAEKAGLEGGPPGFAREDGTRSSVPIAARKKIEITGRKHHVDQKHLVMAGLLAPLEEAVAVSDEFRRIKRPLIRNFKETAEVVSGHKNVIMIASAMPRAGKTFCSVNLAVSMSLERELNVLLVDADVAKPHISREFGLEGRPGLTELLADDNVSLESTLVRTDLNDIVALPAGTPHAHATELLASERMVKVVDELASKYPDRIILVDSPPLLITTEAQALASQVGQIALVVEAGETSHQTLTQAIGVLDSSKAINVILNKSKHLSPKGLYGGDYGYYSYEGT